MHGKKEHYSTLKLILRIVTLGIDIWALVARQAKTLAAWVNDKQDNLIEIFGTYNSPFIRLKPVTYFGKISRGTPHFLPRKWKRMNQKDCEEALQRDIAEAVKYKRPIHLNRDWTYYKKHLKAVPIKYFGINFTSLGWKTKYEDIRFEWPPSLSIVLFGKQFMLWWIVFKDKNLQDDVYWEAWLWYLNRTDKNLSTEERLIQVFEQYTCTWTTHLANGDIYTTDYYLFILKKKWIPTYTKWKLNNNNK